MGFVPILGKSPTTLRRVVSGYAPVHYKYRGSKREILGIVAHCPAGVVPKSYLGRIKDFLLFLGLPFEKYSYMFFRNEKRKTRRHRFLSVLVQYFVIFSVNMRRDIFKSIQRYVTLSLQIDEALVKFHQNQNSRGSSKVRKPFSLSVNNLVNDQKNVWDFFRRSARKLSIREYTEEEFFTALFRTRV